MRCKICGEEVDGPGIFKGDPICNGCARNLIESAIEEQAQRDLIQEKWDKKWEEFEAELMKLTKEQLVELICTRIVESNEENTEIQEWAMKRWLELVRQK